MDHDNLQSCAFPAALFIGNVLSAAQKANCDRLVFDNLGKVKFALFIGNVLSTARLGKVKLRCLCVFNRTHRPCVSGY